MYVYIYSIYIYTYMCVCIQRCMCNIHQYTVCISIHMWMHVYIHTQNCADPWCHVSNLAFSRSKDGFVPFYAGTRTTPKVSGV